ncbi:MAG: hypothetical protein JXA37_13165, partial [Chloroflexia bacterium]|nr:hypothetical protein [Chloroflexia bacterium]
TGGKERGEWYSRSAPVGLEIAFGKLVPVQRTQQPQIAPSDGAGGTADGTDWRLIPRGQPLGAMLHGAVLPGTASTTETLLIGPCYARPEPALAVRQGGSTGTLLYSGTLGALGPGASAAITLTTVPGPAELWAWADPGHKVAEIDESNNLAVRELPAAFRLYLPMVVRS